MKRLLIPSMPGAELSLALFIEESSSAIVSGLSRLFFSSSVNLDKITSG
jgi:hypothetical protein